MSSPPSTCEPQLPPKLLFPLTRLPEYAYEALPTPTSIRVLKLLLPANVAGNDDDFRSDKIHCSLAIVDLMDQPIFDALSYTWGNPFRVYYYSHEPAAAALRYGKQHPIICDGQI